MQKKSLLFVDDDQDLLESTTFLLESEAFEINTATNGLEAISMYEKNKPCLVFMDINMPSMDGYEAFQKIKSIDNDAKIILVSGFAYDESKMESAKQNGLLHVENKPVDTKKYRELITKFD